MLSDTAEANFCPSLTEISRYLKLSPNIAGVTFLALGNGAPDIASIIAGVLSGSTGFGVGEPIGAGLFVTTSVMAAVVLFSEVTVDGVPFLRDVITYLISIGFVFAIYLSGQIVLWQSLMCLAIYLAYVSTVVIGRLVFVYIIQPRQAKAIVSDEDSEEHAEWYSLDDKRRQSLYVGSRYFPKLGLMYSDQEKPLRRAPIAINAPTPQDEETPRDMGTMVIEDHFSPIDNEESKIIYEEEEEEDDYTGFWGKVRQRRDMLLDWIEWDEKSLFQKIFYFIEWPTVLARNLTIPIADPQDWSKFFAVVSPPFIGPFILFSLQKLDQNVGDSPFPLWALLAIIGVVVSIVILITSNRRQPPIYHFVFVFATFGISILWIMIIANELVGLLQAMGVMFKISDGILAMTV
jgi:sodium/potassium/calcium exchanger 6